MSVWLRIPAGHNEEAIKATASAFENRVALAITYASIAQSNKAIMQTICRNNFVFILSYLLRLTAFRNLCQQFDKIRAI